MILLKIFFPIHSLLPLSYTTHRDTYRFIHHNIDINLLVSGHKEGWRGRKYNNSECRILENE
jgi:hypothetical protein